MLFHCGTSRAVKSNTSVISGVVAHRSRQVEGDGEPGLSLGQEVAEAAVRLRRAAEAGVLAHRPEPSAIHLGVDAARERRLSWWWNARLEIGREIGGVVI